MANWVCVGSKCTNTCHPFAPNCSTVVKVSRQRHFSAILTVSAGVKVWIDLSESNFEREHWATADLYFTVWSSASPDRASVSSHCNINGTGHKMAPPSHRKKKWFCVVCWLLVSLLAERSYFTCPWNVQQPSCLLGNVVSGYDCDEEGMGIKQKTYCTDLILFSSSSSVVHVAWVHLAIHYIKGAPSSFGEENQYYNISEAKNNLKIIHIFFHSWLKLLSVENKVSRTRSISMKTGLSFKVKTILFSLFSHGNKQELVYLVCLWIKTLLQKCLPQNYTVHL